MCMRIDIILMHMAEGIRNIYTGFYERSHGDTIEFRPENLRVCLDYLYEWTCQILVKSADQFLSN